MLFVMLAWTLFRAHDFASALSMYSGQFGLNGWAMGDAMQLVMRPEQGMAVMLALVAIIFPMMQPKVRVNAWSLELLGLWPLLAFLLSFALIASRGATPFLYFQF
jgi:alginate O-acetyltransferase complex protein AlgI